MKEKRLFKHRFNSGTWITLIHVKLENENWWKMPVHMKKAIDDITKIHKITLKLHKCTMKTITVIKQLRKK